MEELYARSYGRVQMVMYRDFVKRGARRLGLKGYVKNLDDGTVEAVAQGEREALEHLIERMRRGSLLSHVERVDTTWRAPSKTYDSFDILYE
ncbi:MAG TPA: acylphosphatase [Candidatus Paceibacterota bacterium]